MTKNYKGKLEFVDIGTGHWHLETEDQTYRLVFQDSKMTMPATPCDVRLSASTLEPDLYMADQTNTPLLYVIGMELM